jgi:hypothetical protein
MCMGTSNSLSYIGVNFYSKIKGFVFLVCRGGRKSGNSVSSSLRPNWFLGLR